MTHEIQIAQSTFLNTHVETFDRSGLARSFSHA